MSRIGREPIPVPAGVKITLDNRIVEVSGKLGALQRRIPTGIGITLEDNNILVSRNDDSQSQRALHGLTRALIANMVKGVTSGFRKDMELVGVGYRVELRGPALQFALGYSHRTLVFPPEGVKFEVKNATNFSVIGPDNELVGDTAARIRGLRPPEPYKGKGVKYVSEFIKRKAGKTAGK